MNRLVCVGLGVALCLMGCGAIKGPHQEQADAATPDAPAVDASLTATVNVITQSELAGSGSAFNPGTVTPNITVVALRPDNSVSDMQTTDANGSGTVSIYPGGSVTAVYPHSGSDMGADLVTVFGAQGSDTLTFGSWAGQGFDQSSAGAQVGTVTLTWMTAPASPSEYTFFTPCGEFFAASSALSITLKNFKYCNRTPWEVQGFVNSGTVNPVAMFSSTTVTITNGNGTGGLQLFWGAGQHVTTSVTNIPPEISEVQANLSIALANETDSIDEDNFGFPEYNGFELATSGTPAAGAFSGSGSYGFAGDRSVGEVDLERSGQFGETFLYDNLQTFMGPFQGTSYPVALPALPPYLAGVIGVLTPTKTVGNALWFISTTAAASTFNGTVVQLDWQNTTTVAGSMITSTFHWTAVVPPDITTVSIPPLPGALGTFTPQPNNSLRPRVLLVQIPGVTGYDGLRQVPIRDLASPYTAVANGDLMRVIANFQGN